MLTASGVLQIRTLGYCCQLVGGVLVEQCPARSEVGTRLLTLSSQLSHCRTVLRLFDDMAMFIYTKQYGLVSPLARTGTPLLGPVFLCLCPLPSEHLLPGVGP